VESGVASQLAIGIDVGGTKMAAGLVDAYGQILRRLRVATPASDPEQIVDVISGLVASLRADADGTVAGVGVAVPGQFDHRSGTFVRIANLSLRGFPFRSRLETVTGMTVVIENDTNAAALGEWFAGSGRGYQDFAFVAIGTGIGAGIILGGRLLRGAHGSAGEIGHTVVEKDGPECRCGNRGCLELFASGGVLAARAGEVARRHPDSLLAAMSHGGRSLNGGDLFVAADRGDEISREIVDEAVHYLAVGMNNLIELFDPAIVAIGGGMVQVGESLFERLRRAIRAQRPRSPDVATRIVPATLGDDAGIIGAAAAVRSRT
jgi:glucokinase